MKILELDGFKYSRGKFEGFTHRARVRITTVNDTHFLDIYTTDDDKHRLEEILRDRRHEDVTSLNVDMFRTKEDDDRETEFINEWINSI